MPAIGFDLVAEALRRPSREDAMHACALALTAGVSAHTDRGVAKPMAQHGLEEVIAKALESYPEDPILTGHAAASAAFSRDFGRAAQSGRHF